MTAKGLRRFQGKFFWIVKDLEGTMKPLFMKPEANAGGCNKHFTAVVKKSLASESEAI